MQPDDPLDPFRTLLDAPTPAVLTVYREGGAAVVTPVWFRRRGDAIEVVIAAADPKLAHLRRDPRCLLTIFETVPPFRGLQVRADATLSDDGVAEARRAIAVRYLGTVAGGAFADRRGDRGHVLRLPLDAARTWDLTAILPA